MLTAWIEFLFSRYLNFTHSPWPRASSVTYRWTHAVLTTVWSVSQVAVSSRENCPSDYLLGAHWAAQTVSIYWQREKVLPLPSIQLNSLLYQCTNHSGCNCACVFVCECLCLCLCLCVFVCLCVCVFVCVCVAVVTQHASYCHLWPVRLYNIFPHYLTEVGRKHYLLTSPWSRVLLEKLTSKLCS